MYATCLPSSTFGTKIIMDGQQRPWTFVPPRPGAPIAATAGRTYANVFPLPVSANNTTSSPRESSGIASRWISVVRFSPAFSIAPHMCEGRPARANAFDGSGAASNRFASGASAAAAAAASRAARATSHGRRPPLLYAVFAGFAGFSAIGPASSCVSTTVAVVSPRASFARALSSLFCLPFFSAFVFPLLPSPMNDDHPPSSSSSLHTSS